MGKEKVCVTKSTYDNNNNNNHSFRPSLDIALSPHFHLARCLVRSKHGCDLDTHSIDYLTIKCGDERSVGTLSKLNRAFTVPHAQVYRAKFWHSA